jgi:hypothetical protein
MGKAGSFFIIWQGFTKANGEAAQEALPKGAIVKTKVLMKESHVLHRSCSLCERNI